VTALFRHRYRIIQYCGSCRTIIPDSSMKNESNVHLELFDYDQRVNKPSTPAEFSKMLREIYSSASDYLCPNCKVKVPTLHRVHQLVLVPEILICVFQIYTSPRTGPAKYVPTSLQFAHGDESLVYSQVGQVEHSGSLHGGHYNAIVKRRGSDDVCSSPTIVAVDDAATPRVAAFAATNNTYLVLYHYVGRANGSAVSGSAAAM
jgi:hypothetical protein